MHDVKNLVHYLSMQLRVSRKGDILFLDGRIDKGCIVMMVVVIPVIHTDAFLENELIADHSGKTGSRTQA